MDEEIKTQRKQWQKPELVVLVRSKPEEAVLASCKLNTAGPTLGYLNCYPRAGSGFCLNECETRVSS
jgi:hypothetical protein